MPRSAAVRIGVKHAATSPNLYRAFDTTGYGVLAQLLDLYREDFHSTTNVYVHPQSGKELTRAEAYGRLVDRMEEVTLIAALRDFCLPAQAAADAKRKPRMRP